MVELKTIDKFVNIYVVSFGRFLEEISRKRLL